MQAGAAILGPQFFATGRIMENIIYFAVKDVIFLGSSLDGLRAFPDDARREAGFQIDAVQRGKEPDDWKPMKSVGQGVREIRIHREGSYRVVYVAKFEEGVYVLHAFQKTTQKTPRKDIEFARSRYRALIKERVKR